MVFNDSCLCKEKGDFRHPLNDKNMVKKKIYIFKKQNIIPFTWFKVQGFFICHIIVIQGIIRSEM